MNKTTFNSRKSPQDRLGRAIASRLDQSLTDVPHDISERLKVARMQALGKRRIATVEAATVGVSGGSAVLQGGRDVFGFWGKLGSALPLLALVVGLILIGVIQDEMRAMEAAEVDSALLVDELPPAAYTDPGFAHFLRSQLSD